MALDKILVIEDEEITRDYIETIFTSDGFTVYTAKDGEAGIEIAQNKHPDAVILDLMLPGIDGMEVARKLRGNKDTAHILIIMLTGKDDEFDIVIGLESFADAYLTKPFKPRVLLANVKAALRRKELIAQDDDSSVESLVFDNLSIDMKKMTVLVDSNEVELTKTEFDILTYLSRRPDWVFSRDQIIIAVKGDDYPVTDRAIDVAILRLRKKLGNAGSFIETVRGVGYRFSLTEK